MGGEPSLSVGKKVPPVRVYFPHRRRPALAFPMSVAHRQGSPSRSRGTTLSSLEQLLRTQVTTALKREGFFSDFGAGRCAASGAIPLVFYHEATRRGGCQW